MHVGDKSDENKNSIFEEWGLPSCLPPSSNFAWEDWEGGLYPQERRLSFSLLEIVAWKKNSTYTLSLGKENVPHAWHPSLHLWEEVYLLPLWRALSHLSHFLPFCLPLLLCGEEKEGRYSNV